MSEALQKEHSAITISLNLEIKLFLHVFFIVHHSFLCVLHCNWICYFTNSATEHFFYSLPFIYMRTPMECPHNGACVRACVRAFVRGQPNKLYKSLNRACGGQGVQRSCGTSRRSQKTPSSQVVITSSTRMWMRSWNLLIPIWLECTSIYWEEKQSNTPN